MIYFTNKKIRKIMSEYCKRNLKPNFHISKIENCHIEKLLLGNYKVQLEISHEHKLDDFGGRIFIDVIVTKLFNVKSINCPHSDIFFYKKGVIEEAEEFLKG